MAKKISAEKFGINSYEIADDGNDKLAFGTAGGSLTTQADSLEIDSIDTRVSIEVSTRTSAVSSEDTRVSLEVSTRTSAVSSEDTRVSIEVSTRTSTVTSVDARMTAEESTTKIMLDNSCTQNQDYLTVDFTALGYEENSEPVIMGQLRSTDSDDPIIIAMLSGAAHHDSATFLFSDDIPSANYKLDIIFTR